MEIKVLKKKKTPINYNNIPPEYHPILDGKIYIEDLTMDEYQIIGNILMQNKITKIRNKCGEIWRGIKQKI